MNSQDEIQRPPRKSARRLPKRIVQSVFFILALPRILCYRFAFALLGDRAFTPSSESIARIPGMRGIYMRQAFYRATLDACGRDVYLGWNSVLSMPEARVGETAFIGRFCSIGFADIGMDVMIADGVQILSGGHEHDSSDATESMHDQGQKYERVRIGKGAWIGAGAIVMADVGNDAIVGAGAVVTRAVPAGAVAVGVPAKVIHYRDGWSEPQQENSHAKPE